VNILFVCTANIVRSYMAEAVLKGKLNKMQKGDVFVHSAGIMDLRGAPPDPIAEKILDEAGLPLPEHRSTVLSREMVDRADMIVVMEVAHQAAVLNAFPGTDGKLRLLKTFSRDYDGVNAEIRDPHRRSIFLYRQCFSEIYLALDGLLKCI
jgi:protein-tyrosine-phosphatase